MRILVYGLNFSPELIGVGKYTSEMCSWLVNNGHEVRVITAPPYYPEWKVWSGFSKFYYSHSMNFGMRVWRCPLFVPLHPKFLFRIVHLTSFVISSLPILFFQLWWKPNIIFLVAPTLLCAPQTLLLAKLTKAKSILHIQDLEVDALFGLDASIRHHFGLLRKSAFFFQSLMFRSFDIVSTISVSMMKRIQNERVSPQSLRFLPNWSDIAHFHDSQPSSALLQKLGVRPGCKVILYSGNMGEKQGLEIVIFAARQLLLEDNLIFLMVGDGSSRNRLSNMAKSLNLSNVIFAPLQSYEDLPSLLASATVHLIIQRRGVADALLPSKLSNILAVGGNSVVTADPHTTLGRLPSDNPGITVVVQPESVDALVLGIETAILMPNPNHIALNYARAFLDKNQVLSRFLDRISI
ncbi:MAG: WcaI family glycosyltransferase [Alphaproteobacteria bacterium]